VRIRPKYSATNENSLFQDARVHLRHALELTGIYTDAEETKAKDSISEETRIHFLLGQCGMEMGKYDEALTSYNHALKVKIVIF